MLDKIITFSIKNKLVIGLLTIALIAWGIFSFVNLPIDAVPDITNNQVQVITISPSLAPQEVEQFITFPVETAMANIQDVTEIRSLSRFGLSVVTIVFKDDVDVMRARQIVSEQIVLAAQQIPAEYGSPEMMPVTTGLGEIYQYVLEAKPGYEDQYSLFDLRTIQDWIVKRQLAGIPGIVEISSFGGLLKQFEVAVDPKHLVGMNITIPEIFDALENNNQNSGGSYIEKRQEAYYIRTEGIVKDSRDIEQIVVKEVNGLPITIRDVAVVKIGAPPRFGAMTKDGKGEAVGGITLMLKGANSDEVTRLVKERIRKVEKILPPGLEINPYLDRSLLIGKTMHTVTTNLIEGGLIVIFVLVLLLGNMRSGLIVASVIPLSMLFAIAMMRVFHVSANLMSLGAIDFGLIVDGTVIVVEGIMHQLQKHFNLQRLDQQKMDETIFKATSRVSHSAVFGVLIILIVYVPIFAFTGIEGKMFKPMAQTVSFALIGALILSFTYVPMIASIFLRKKVVFKKNISEKIMGHLHRWHDKTLDVALRLPVLVIIGASIIVVISLWIFSRMGGEFLPTLEEGDLACQLTLPPGSSLSQSIATTTMAEKILTEQFPEVIHVVSKIGSAEVPTDPMAIEDADVMITMKPKKEWLTAHTREEMVDKMKEALAVIPGASFDFSQPIQLRFNELMTGVKTDVAVKIFGEDLDILFDQANKAASIISKITGAGDVKVDQIVGLPQLVVTFNRDKIAQNGLNINEMNSIIRTAFAGQAAGLVFEGERRFDLVVRLDEEYRKDIDALYNLRVNRPNEELILLSQVADIHEVSGPMMISREETKRRATIGINVRNRDVESFIDEVDRELTRRMVLPPGYYFTYGGQFENLKSAKRTSSIAVPVALAAIFIMLFFAFNSFKQSVMVFTAIPLAAVGGILALLIRGMPFSISAGVGFIALFGIAVLNGIVLISHYNQLEKEGISDIWERIKQGTSDRLRPVIMTSLVAAFGFVPMALSTAAGAEVQKPLATVVIGGILTASVLTLVVLPVLYFTFQEGFHCALTRIRLWPRKKLPPVAMFLLLLLFPFAMFGQDRGKPTILTMPQAVDRALQNATEIKNFELEKKAEKSLIMSEFDLAGPTVSIETGEINSALKDYKVVISQEIDFPMVYVEKVAAQKAKTEVTSLLSELKKVELVTEVKSVYMEWWITSAKLLLKEKQDSIFGIFYKATSRQFEAGDVNQLDVLISESRKAKTELDVRSLRADVESMINDLKTMIHSDTDYVTPAAFPTRLDTPLLPPDGLSDNLTMNYLESSLNYEKANLRKESWQLAPSFSIGWFTQSLDDIEPFTGWTYGISLPIWFWVPMGKIKSAKIRRDIASNEIENGMHHLESRWYRYRKELEKAEYTLTYFDEKGLSLSLSMISSAEKSYRAGEINLFQYIFTLNEAFALQLEYLDALNSYNQTVIRINNLLGNI
ncbi:MAG: CusA/CzcA family heavy metal efflux RND transporter [Bacteroidales bacterium]|nr:CusA/CzcA family heavy metal efflux RND transporter [Bacteroidales bacterium]